MKRIFSAFIITLVLSLVVFPIFAEDTANGITVISLVADKDNLSAGESLKVTCTVTNSIAIGGFQFDTNFDTSRLELTNFEIKTLTRRGNSSKLRGDLWSKTGATVASINSDGYFRILYLYSKEPAAVDINVGDIFVLTFKAKTDCYAGTVYFDIANVTLGDTSAGKMVYAKSTTAVTVNGLEAPASSESSTPADSSSSGNTSSADPATSSGTANNGSGLDKIVVGGSDSITIEDGKSDYTVHVDGKTNDINIGGIPKNEDSKVLVEGGNNLKEGENNVKVTVVDKDGKQKVYNVKVIKEKGGSNHTYLYIIIGAVVLLALAATATVLLLVKKRKAAKI